MKRVFVEVYVCGRLVDEYTDYTDHNRNIEQVEEYAREQTAKDTTVKIKEEE